MEGIKDMDLKSVSRRHGIDSRELQSFLEMLHKSMRMPLRKISVRENGVAKVFVVELRGVGKLKTEFGYFWHYDFRINDQWEKYSVLVKAEIDETTFCPIFKNKAELVLRTDSGCETGQLFGDVTCECNEQLDLAMKTISEEGEGMIVHIPRQDGRGMGLPFKLATLWIQNEYGINTVEAASLLASGGSIDERTYAGVICVLKYFGISSACHVRLATNNPHKTQVFYENGYALEDCMPMLISPTENTKHHLAAKQKCLGHRGLVQAEEEPDEPLKVPVQARGGCK